MYFFVFIKVKNIIIKEHSVNHIAAIKRTIFIYLPFYNDEKNVLFSLDTNDFFRQKECNTIDFEFYSLLISH